MKLQSVNMVPLSTHTVINDLTLSRALKHSGLSRAGQSLTAQTPPLSPLIRYDTTSWNRLGWREPSGLWGIDRKYCSQICPRARHLTCERCSGSRYVAASCEYVAEEKNKRAIPVLSDTLDFSKIELTQWPRSLASVAQKFWRPF